MAAPAIVQANKLTLLGLVNAATAEIGLPQYTSIVSNTDSQAIQILALAKREGKEFYGMAHRLGGWEELRKQYTFTTSAITGLTGNTTINSPIITNISSTVGITALTWGISGTGIPQDSHVLSVDSATQVTLDQNCTATGTAVALAFGQEAYSFPNDFAYFIQKTMWDRSYRWQLMGPLTPQEWQVIKSGISPTGPRRRFRVVGNRFLIDPVPNDSITLEAFEYYSNAWCQSSSGTARSTWGADGDYYSLDDDCFILGLKWRILAAKKLDYEQEYDTYMKACERAISRNGGNRDLPMNAVESGQRLLSMNQVPDTGYGA